MIKDFGRRHPNWIGAEYPPYTTHDASYDLKLQRAREWLGRWDRGAAGSTHVYRNSDGKRTQK